MAWIVGDGFDYYANTGDLARSVWDSFSAFAPSFQAGRFAGSQSLELRASTLTKNFANDPTVYCALAYYRGGSGGVPLTLTVSDGGTAQASITVNTDNTITLRRGGSGGTVIATASMTVPAALWTHYQFRIVLNATTGAFTVRVNGSSFDNYAATGLNTISTANAYANNLTVAGNESGTWIDDVLWFTGSGAAPNTWVGDVRALCLRPMADTAQKNFTGVPGGTMTFGSGSTASGFSIALSANTVYTTSLVSPTRGGQLSKVTAISLGAATGHVQTAVYANDGASGLPGTLLGTSAVVTNPAASGNVDFTFATPVALSSARQYYFAFLLDTAWSPQVGGTPGYFAARTYSAGFPNPAGALSTMPGNVPYLLGTVGGNSLMVSEPLANGDTDYVTSTTVNDEDLYALDALPVTPYAIVGVVSKVYIHKSDAGTRQGQLRLKSGTTEVAGVDTAVSSTYSYLARVDTTDPNTSAAWTAAAVNALQVGQKTTL